MLLLKPGVNFAFTLRERSGFIFEPLYNITFIFSSTALRYNIVITFYTRLKFFFIFLYYYKQFLPVFGIRFNIKRLIIFIKSYIIILTSSLSLSGVIGLFM